MNIHNKHRLYLGTKSATILHILFYKAAVEEAQLGNHNSEEEHEHSLLLLCKVFKNCSWI